MISAVFFDFGGVIATSPFDAFASYEQRSGLPDGFLRSVNATNPQTNVGALERGELGLDGFVSAFESEALALGHAVDGREVLACLQGELRPRMVAAVRSCATRFTTALLTNNHVAAASVGPAVVELLDVFHHVVESSQVGMRKPEVAFYELACERAGVAPTEVVFLDDLGINLKPARAMGMTTIKVLDPDAALDELAAVTGLAL